MIISGPWLQSAALKQVMAAFSAAGHGCYVVGGAVRNALLGLPVCDIDLATSAPPSAVMALAEGAGFRAVPTGLSHGTVTLIASGTAFEVTTFRRDLATDGRHAQVAFTDDLALDAQRRDFTINALYADAQGQVIDPVGGLPDIAARRLRFVGAPGARIAEDYLRILRYFRFFAHYADPAHGFDADALAACAAGVDGLSQLSRERIGQEMRKLLAARDPAPALATMQAIGVLMQVLPGADARAIAPLVHIEAGQPSAWVARLAALGGVDASAALRLSRSETAQLQAMNGGLASPATPAALAYLHGAAMARDILHLRAALLGQGLPQGWQAALDRGAGAICPISAADFMPRLTGPALGRALAQAQQAWLDSDLRAEKADLLQG